MKKLWTCVFALLALTASWQQAAAQEAASSINGIWLNTTKPAGELAFMTIIHSASGHLAIVSTTGAAELQLLGIEGYFSAALVGTADTRALGDNIGTAMSVPEVFYGADVRINLHRPSQNELIVELTSCETESLVVSCERIYQDLPLNERVLHTKVF